MRRLLSIGLISLFLVQGCMAAPRWLKKTIEYTIYAAPIVTSALAAKGGLDCRSRNDVDSCSGKYGSYPVGEGIRMSISVTMSVLSMVGHKEHYKEWFAPAIGVSSFDTYWWRHEEDIRQKSSEQTSQKIWRK